MALPSMALPGQLLGAATTYLPGPGTHIHDSQIYASIGGPVIRTPTSVHDGTKTQAQQPHQQQQHTPSPQALLSISRPTTTWTSSPSGSSSAAGIVGPSSGTGAPILPTLTSRVLCQITRVTARSASCVILAIDDTPCRQGFGAQIRREDIRATEKDKVVVAECFRVGDLVRATVISLGDQAGYFVTTAENALGVVLARGDDGRVLVPVSWREVRDPVTGRGESRKVAKPF